jgi:hypothetical protein
MKPLRRNERECVAAPTRFSYHPFLAWRAMQCEVMAHCMETGSRSRRLVAVYGIQDEH